MPLPFPVRGISVRFSVGVRNSLQAYSTVSGEGIWVNNCLENFFFSHCKSAIYSPCIKQLLNKDNTISEREYFAPMPRCPSGWSINVLIPERPMAPWIKFNPPQAVIFLEECLILNIVMF